MKRWSNISGVVIFPLMVFLAHGCSVNLDPEKDQCHESLRFSVIWKKHNPLR